MRNALYILISALALVSLTWGCDSSDCTSNRNSLPLAGFRTSGAPSQSVSFDSLAIEGIGAPSDSMLIVKNASQSPLPFNFEKHSTVFVLHYAEAPVAMFDTIEFRYNPEPRFVSADCGVVYEYTMTGVSHTSHAIDSVSIPAEVIDNTPGQNIFIYFKPGL